MEPARRDCEFECLCACEDGWPGDGRGDAFVFIVYKTGVRSLAVLELCIMQDGVGAGSVGGEEMEAQARCSGRRVEG